MIDAQDRPQGSLWSRVARRFRRQHDYKDHYISVLGIRVLHLTVDKWRCKSPQAVHKRLQAMFERLQAARVGKVLFSQNFPYRLLFLTQWFTELSERSLMELMAGEIAVERSMERNCVAFFTDHMTVNAELVLIELCRSFRYLLLIADAGDAFSLSLGRRYGISVITDPTDEQLLRAETAVFFNAPHHRTVLSDGCITVPVDRDALNDVHCSVYVDGITVGFKDGRALCLPEGFPASALISAALDAGTTSRDELQLEAVRLVKCR